MHITYHFASPRPKSSATRILLPLGAGILILGLLALLFLLFFPHTTPAPTAQASPNALHPFTITSPDFHDGGPIPQKFAGSGRCTGSNVPPQLDWINAPAGTQSFVLLMSDYDAPVDGGFHHWVVYNIPTSAHELASDQVFTQGNNGAGRPGYTGPCPPATGEPHHYLFLLYAVDIAHVGGPGLQFDAVISAIQHHVRGATSIIGTFRLPQ